MTTIFCIPGTPVGKQRPRFDSRTKRTYTPKKTVGYEHLVRLYAKQAKVPHFEGHIVVSISLYMPDARQRDCDNAAKSITDALNKVAWKDDSQIVELHIRKRIDRTNPRAVVTIEQFREEAA